MKRKLFTAFLSLSVLLAACVIYAQDVKHRVRPHEFGDVVMNNFSEKNNIAPVVFKHWLHRAKFTCRLCHIDLGFAMEGGNTKVSESDNKNGLYCGACHNGKTAFAPEEKDAMGNITKNCYKCHSYGKDVKFKNDFYAFTKGFPKSRFGNKVDWIEAEDKGLVKLIDSIEGITIKRKPISAPKDVDLKSAEPGMPDIIYSHKKHVIWNGCELCHPDIFTVKKGASKIKMLDIFAGKYCGVCHGKVAFPNNDCQLCHMKEV
mgnify:CR=1 FL=1